MQLFSSLKHHPFAWLWLGQTVSRLGDSFYRIALAWWVLEATGSAAAMGTVLIFTSVPMLIFLLVGGIAVDRFSRSHIMLFSDFGRGAIVGVVGLLAYLGQLELWHIYLASIVFGFVDAFFQPAFTALVPEVTPQGFLSSANSLTSLSEKLAGVVGPALGAVIVSAGGTSAAFLLDGVTFILSALCVIPVLHLSASAQKTETNVINDLKEGFRTVITMPWMWITILIASLFNITNGSVIAIATPFLVKDQLFSDVNVLGWVYSAMSIGSVVAAVGLGQLKHISHRGWLLYLSTILSGATTIIIGVSTYIPLTLIAICLCGASITIFGLAWINTLQERVPRDQLGRVASIDMLGSFVLLPIGYGIIGWMTDLMGAGSIFIWGGIITIFLAVLGLIHPAIRALD
jgi:MFS family permease